MGKAKILTNPVAAYIFKAAGLSMTQSLSVSKAECRALVIEVWKFLLHIKLSYDDQLVV